MAGCRWVYVVLSAVAVLGLTQALIPHRRMTEFDLHRARAQEMIAAASKWAETSEELSPGEVAAYFRDGGYKLTEKVAAENVGGSQGMGRESGRLQGDSDENVENIDQQDSSPLPAALNDNEEQNPVENGGGGSMQGDKEDTNPAPNNNNDNNNNDNNNNNNNNGNEDEEDTSPLPNVLSEDKNNNNQNQNGYDRSEEGEVEEKTDVSGKYRDDNRLLTDSDVPLEDQVWTQDDREEQEALIEEQKEKQAALWRQEVEEMEEEQEAAMRRLEEEQEAAMRRLEMEQEVAAMRVEEEAKKDNEALKMQDDKQKQPVAPKGMNRDEPDPINPFNGGNEEEVVIQSLASMSQVDFRETADIAGYPSRSEERMEPQPSEQEEQDEENAVDNIIEALRRIAGNGEMTPVSPAVPIHTPEQVYPPVYPCPTFETVNDERPLTRRPQESAEGRAINQEDVETQGPIEKVLVEAGVMSHESDGGRGQLGQTQDHVDDDNNNQPQPPPDNQPQPPPDNQPQPPPENQPQPPPENQPQPPPDNQPQPPPDNQPQPPPDNQPQPPPDNQPQPPPAPGGPQAQQGTAQSNDGEVSVQEAIAHAQALKAFFMNHKN